MSNRLEELPDFDNTVHLQWRERGVLSSLFADEKLQTSLIDLMDYVKSDADYSSGSRFIEASVYSGIITVEQLVLVGTNPVASLKGGGRRGGSGLSAFKNIMRRFWPAMELPTMPSPHIAAMLYDHPRQIRTFPWIIDYLDHVPIGSGITDGRAPVREIYWSLELLLGAHEDILRNVFELRTGRTDAILDYYNEYEALFHRARNKAV